MALGQTGQLDNTSREGHLGGDIDGAILGTGDTDITLTVGGGRRPDGTYIVSTEWIAHKGKAITCKAGPETAGVGASKGFFSLSGNGDRVHGKLLSVDDDGRGSIGCIGMNMEFGVPEKTLDNTNAAVSDTDLDLDHSIIGEPVVGADGGLVVPLNKISSPSNAQRLNARGIITDYDTATRKVKVNLWA